MAGLTPDDIRVGQRVQISNDRGSWYATVVSRSQKRIVVVGDDGVQRSVQYNSKESLAQHDGFVGWYDPAVGMNAHGRVYVELRSGPESTFVGMLLRGS